MSAFGCSKERGRLILDLAAAHGNQQRGLHLLDPCAWSGADLACKFCAIYREFRWECRSVLRIRTLATSEQSAGPWCCTLCGEPSSNLARCVARIASERCNVDAVFHMINRTALRLCRRAVGGTHLRNGAYGRAWAAPVRQDLLSNFVV
jgi:hypothetical protein